jgi:hypothetical protein
LLQAEVALFVGATGAEANTGKGWPCSPLEEEDGENNTESESKGGLDEEVRETAVPLRAKSASQYHINISLKYQLCEGSLYVPSR